MREIICTREIAKAGAHLILDRIETGAEGYSLQTAHDVPLEAVADALRADRAVRASQEGAGEHGHLRKRRAGGDRVGMERRVRGRDGYIGLEVACASVDATSDLLPSAGRKLGEKQDVRSLTLSWLCWRAVDECRQRRRADEGGCGRCRQPWSGEDQRLWFHLKQGLVKRQINGCSQRGPALGDVRLVDVATARSRVLHEYLEGLPKLTHAGNHAIGPLGALPT